MKIKIAIGDTFKTQQGLFLKVKKVGGADLHTFWLIDEDGNTLPELRNYFGHVIRRNSRICSEETILSFEKINLKNN